MIVGKLNPTTMKKLLNPFLLVALFVSATFFVSCSGDDSVAKQESAADANSFLSSYYGTNIRLGRTVEVGGTASTVDRSASSKVYTVTEVFVGNEPRARGYNVTDKLTGAPIFFADIDRVNFVARVYEYQSSSTTVLANINLSPDYGWSNGLDLIIVITDPGYSDPPMQQVLGWVYTYGAPYMYNGQCYKAVYRQYRALGINWTKVEAVKDSNGNNLAIPCNETYSGPS